MELTSLGFPPGITAHLDDTVLYHLRPEYHETEFGLIDAFRGHSLNLDDTLQQQLLFKETKTIQVSLNQFKLQAKLMKSLSQEII